MIGLMGIVVLLHQPPLRFFFEELLSVSDVVIEGQGAVLLRCSSIIDVPIAKDSTGAWIALRGLRAQLTSRR
jgi:hypothetical protein